ncbi:unnamed protein product [Malus baccata var. baccata]
MENKKQDQQQRASTDGASKRISATYSEPTPPSEHFDLDLDHNTDPKDDPQKPGWRKFLAHVGPGFLVSLAYLDPGNLETDLQAGANHRYEVRKLEMLIAVLVFVMAACFFGEMSYVKPPASGVLKGMFIPKLSGQGATGDAIALLGALVMPHNLFLHSALVLSRKIPKSVRGINDACRYFLIESGFALFVAFLINVAIVSVSGTVCHHSNLSDKDNDTCSDLTLNSASFLLQNVLGRSSKILYAIALLASGQSSTITGTYAGQFVMQGFLNIKMKKWARNLMTRCIAITPSLIVSIIGGSSGAGRLIIIASIIVISWILGMGIIGINIYYLSTGFVGWIIHSSLPKVATVFIGILVFPFMAIYILAVLYLTLRKDCVVTFVEPTKNDPAAQNQMENGLPNYGEPPVPFREDLADIHLPK